MGKTQLQLRGASTTDKANAFIGADREVIVDQEAGVLVVQDGTTPGGTRQAKEDHTHTVDQSDAEIKTAYENNADTNVFTDAEEGKLADLPTIEELTMAFGTIKNPIYQLPLNNSLTPSTGEGGVVQGRLVYGILNSPKGHGQFFNGG